LGNIHGYVFDFWLFELTVMMGLDEAYDDTASLCVCANAGSLFFFFTLEGELCAIKMGGLAYSVTCSEMVTGEGAR
jgi:hypothetical protein